MAWPKKASKVPTDLTEDVQREIWLPLGLVDTKVCAIDDVWSGLRLCWRTERRRRAQGRSRRPTEDEAGAAVPGEVVPRPVEEHRHPVAEADQVHRCRPSHASHPGVPWRRSVGSRPAAGSRPPPPGGRSWPSCPCRGSGTAAAPRPRAPGGSRRRRARPDCMATWATPGSEPAGAVVDGGDVADGEGLGVARDAQVGPDDDAAAPAGGSTPRASASGLARTPAAQMSVWAASSSPDRRGGRGSASTAATAVAGAHLDAAVLEGRSGVGAGWPGRTAGSRSSPISTRTIAGPARRRGAGSRGAARRRTARRGRRPPRRRSGRRRRRRR